MFDYSYLFDAPPHPQRVSETKCLPNPPFFLHKVKKIMMCLSLPLNQGGYINQANLVSQIHKILIRKIFCQDDIYLLIGGDILQLQHSILHHLLYVLILVIYVLCLSMEHQVLRKHYKVGVFTIYHHMLHRSFKQVEHQLYNFFGYFKGCNVFSLNTTQSKRLLISSHQGYYGGSRT